MISCHYYDYIEIVCMHSYPVCLTLKSGQMVEGIAVDTMLNASRVECIRLTVEGVNTELELDKISQLTVSIDNPHFKQVNFD
ncbi:Rho-binding antiterminator [Marinomonas sp. C2222]|uniref:Rho-binding antiterminator n=1 Tax=Marinomonas sargassi TaxID=2984494 RepID=A0ABT2YW31_9GAMM|nr:Rho-binding antiterminator [Marinomonas sargassi]MCV2404089.1 Rho-binding antiterminator [Marinomonas sargassi]